MTNNSPISPILQPVFRSIVRDVFDQDIVESGGPAPEVGTLLATYTGSLTGTRSILIDVSSDTVLDWGDGNTTPLLASNGEHLYSHPYVGASSPEISIQDQELVTVISTNELTGFTIEASGVNQFENLSYYENVGENQATFVDDEGLNMSFNLGE